MTTNTDNMTPLGYRLHLESRSARAEHFESIQVNSHHMGVDELTFALEQLGSTQAELAATIGVDPSTVWRWIKGATQIPRPTAALIRLMVDLK
jgi:DNA-binding transcriptional regulator YiaG